MFRVPRRASWYCARGAFAAIALSISARHGDDLAGPGDAEVGAELIADAPDAQGLPDGPSAEDAGMGDDGGVTREDADEPQDSRPDEVSETCGEVTDGPDLLEWDGTSVEDAHGVADDTFYDSASPDAPDADDTDASVNAEPQPTCDALPFADRRACEAHADCASGVCTCGRTATEHRKSTGESFLHPGKI